MQGYQDRLNRRVLPRRYVLKERNLELLQNTHAVPNRPLGQRMRWCGYVQGSGPSKIEITGPLPDDDGRTGGDTAKWIHTFRQSGE